MGRLYREDPVTEQWSTAIRMWPAMEAERASVIAALLLDSGDAVDNGLSRTAARRSPCGPRRLVPAVGEFASSRPDDFFAALGSVGGRRPARPGNHGRGHPKPGGGCLRGLYCGAGPRAVRIGGHGGAEDRVLVSACACPPTTPPQL